MDFLKIEAITCIFYFQYNQLNNMYMYIRLYCVLVSLIALLMDFRVSINLFRFVLVYSSKLLIRLGSSIDSYQILKIFFLKCSSNISFLQSILSKAILVYLHF